MSEKLTEEEHIARAMLMGMRYHHGNGEPFYYVDGPMDVTQWLDANTLKPLVTQDQLPGGYGVTTSRRASKAAAAVTVEALTKEWERKKL